MTTETPELDAIVEEARNTLDLSARMRNRGLRTGQITVYDDEITGEKLGTARDITNAFGVTVGREQTGVLGEIDKFDPETGDPKKLARLEAERDALAETLRESALTFHLRAVPPVIAKSHARKAKDMLKIKGPVPEDQETNFNDAKFALMLVDVVTDVVDPDGNSTGRLTYETAKDIIDYHPQLSRLVQKVGDLQFRDSIDESIQSDSDF